MKQRVFFHLFFDVKKHLGIVCETRLFCLNKKLYNFYTKSHKDIAHALFYEKEKKLYYLFIRILCIKVEMIYLNLPTGTSNHIDQFFGMCGFFYYSKGDFMRNLCGAVLGGHKHLLKNLCEDEYCWWWPIVYASYGGHKDIISVLMKKYISPTLNQKNIALMAAAVNGFDDLFEIFLNSSSFYDFLLSFFEFLSKEEKDFLRTFSEKDSLYIAQNVKYFPTSLLNQFRDYMDN